MLLAALLAILLVAPLWKLRGRDHPLAGVQTLELCPLLPPPPPSLGNVHATPGNPATPVCTFVDGQGRHTLTVTLSSTRQLSREGAVDTEKLFDTWMLEVRASYQNGGPVAGPWRHGGTWLAGTQQSLLFEDGGVMVLVESFQLDADAVARYALAVQAALRGPQK